MRPAAATCEINPTGLVLWRCHTHGSPALRQGPCFAASSDRRLARIWSSQATTGRLIGVHQ